MLSVIWYMATSRIVRFVSFKNHITAHQISLVSCPEHTSGDGDMIIQSFFCYDSRGGIVDKPIEYARIRVTDGSRFTIPLMNP